jgi:hypothetical protein
MHTTLPGKRSHTPTSEEASIQEPFTRVTPVLKTALLMGAGGGFVLATVLTLSHAFSIPLGARWEATAQAHGHLHLNEKCRNQLLSMSAATADRLLRFQRLLGPRGISTTQAGTLLKHQIPIRTFQDWSETQPGLTFGRPGCRLRHTSRGRLSVHLEPHRHRDGLDRMPSPLVSESRDSAGCLPTRTNALSFPHSGHRY